MNVGCTYCLKDPDTGLPRYVGQTIQKPAIRRKDHLGEKGETYKCYWVQSLLKLGKLPIFEIIEDNILIEDLDWAEEYQIALFRFLGYPLTNISDGGGNTFAGLKHREDSIQKIRESNLGTVFSKERCMNIRMALKNLPPEKKGVGGRKNKGRVCPEHVKKISREELSGKPHSEEHNRKVSESKKNKPFSDAHRKSISISKIGHIPWNKGLVGTFHHTEDAKQRIRNTQLLKLQRNI